MQHSETLKIFQSLLIQLDEESTDNQQPLYWLSSCIEKIRHSIMELENYIKENPLSNTEEEILYFKQIRPMFCAQLIYYTETFNLERALQLIDKNEWLCYLKDEMKMIPRFFKKNNFLHEYYRLGLSELDHLYFTRKASAKSLLLPEFPTLEFTAAASTSYIFAKIMAYEKLREHIQFKLNELEPAGNIETAMNGDKNKLKWTGETINLVEMAYGLWLTGQINNGNVSITEIIEWLESRLGVRVGRAYRRWTEISRRKILSPTKYLDQMRSELIKRIDQENGLH
jgi:hypothetical protein